VSEQVLVSRTGAVCEIRLNRPEKRNAITLAMYAALVEALQSAEEDDSITTVLLSGAGASFTAGNDLNDFLSGPPAGEGKSATQFIRMLPTLQKVLVAAVHGTVVGIGVTMLLHCDLVLAARSARLSMPFVRLGLVPEAASSLLLPRLIGHHRAAELLLLGVPVDAPAAHSMGLINRVTDDDALMGEARAVARAVSEQPKGALRATKKLLRSGTSTASARIEEELLAFAERLASPELKAAAAAFLGKGRSE